MTTPDPRCSFCGKPGSYANPLNESTWGPPYVSRPFPAHPGCAIDFLADRISEQEERP